MRWLVFLCAVLALACGGGTPKSTLPSGASIEDIDKDPIILLPSAPLGIASLDARALVDDKTLGKPVASLADKLVPLGEESGFSPSRDVDRIIVGSYSLEGVDFAGVLSGRFDQEKISATAKNHTPTKTGGVLVETTYNDHSIYTVASTGFSVVSAKTVLIGTETAIRRSLDRLKAGTAKRDMQPWIYDTLDTKGAAFAVAADLASQSLASVAIGGLNLPFAKGLRVVRAVGNFGTGAVNVAGTATWSDEAGAKAGADGIKSLARLVAPFAVAGVVPQIQNLKIDQQQSDVQVTFSIDAKQLADVVTKIPQFM